MKLSVVIVSYNVTHFLEHCLHSVVNAWIDDEMEVFVVDNASVDGSVQMVREKFPQVHCIANSKNTGFAVANNQAIRQAKGEFVLLLNPDTVVEPDTFRSTVDFMAANPDAGGLGVMMVDGKGNFLPESKRGLPTPFVSLCKMTGLSKLFPNSRTFNRYHLGYLDKNEIHKVDVLSGAFMMLRKKTLDEVGLLDEEFFMYGEDIDLSYRIIKGGYNNYYFPKTRIIHYKGESTKKGSLNYVYLFYNAMIIFANKHFSTKRASFFAMLIRFAIWVKASFAVVKNVFAKALLPLLDAFVIYSGVFAFAKIWEKTKDFADGQYPDVLFYVVLPIIAVVAFYNIFLMGGYDFPIKLKKSFSGVALSSVVLLIGYSLLPESVRFSRSIFLFAALWGFPSVAITRFALHFLNRKKYNLNTEKSKRFAIVGNKEEILRVTEILKHSLPNFGAVFYVNPIKSSNNEKPYIGSVSQIIEIVNVNKINEVIFCAKDMSARDIIDYMLSIKQQEVDFKIAPPDSLSIIGSNSINTAGDLYTIDLNSIIKQNNRRTKRVFDFITSFALLILIPVNIFIIPNFFQFLKNIIKVIFAKASISGFDPIVLKDYKLPELKKGILYPSDGFEKIIDTQEIIQRINIQYARNYKLSQEFRILYYGYKKLGRKLI